MPVCMVVDNPNGNAELFDEVSAKLAERGALPPDGGLVQVAGDVDGTWRVISVWDSDESMQRFMQEHLFPAFEQAGVSQEGVQVSRFETHSFMSSGAAGPGMS